MPFQLFPFLPLHPLQSSFFPWCSKRQIISNPPPPPPKKRLKQSFQTKRQFSKPKRRSEANSFPLLPRKQRLEDFVFLLSKIKRPHWGVGAGLGIPYPFNISWNIQYPLNCAVSYSWSLRWISPYLISRIPIILSFGILYPYNFCLCIPYPFNIFLKYSISP